MYYTHTIAHIMMYLMLYIRSINIWLQTLCLLRFKVLILERKQTLASEKNTIKAGIVLLCATVVTSSALRHDSGK